MISETCQKLVSSKDFFIKETENEKNKKKIDS